MGPFVHGRLLNLKTSEDTLGHDMTPQTINKDLSHFIVCFSSTETKKSPSRKEPSQSKRLSEK